MKDNLNKDAKKAKRKRRIYKEHRKQILERRMS